MRRTLTLAIAVVLVVGSAVWAGAAIRSRHQADRAVAPSPGLERVSKSWKLGPSAVVDFDYGSIGVVTPLQVSLPAGATYDVTVALSLDYHSSPDDRFVVELGVNKDGRYGPDVPVTPGRRPVPASDVGTSMTTLFRVKHVEGDHVYWFLPSVNVSHRDDKARIDSRHVLMVVDAVPAA